MENKQMIDLKALIAAMTLEDKASLCASPDFYHTRGIERLGIPSLVLADGANGVRRHVESDEAQMDDWTFPAVCFPSGATIACSWDKNLLQRVGEALGESALILGVDVLLGPAINIKRSPLCGRNFEYYSEDPFLSSALATSYIKGVQSKGIGTSIKHFAANNQESKRMSVDVRVDERTLREIYLASFEAAIIEAQPWTVMCAYNQINGAYCSENGFLLNDVLRKDWKFEGAVISDWGAVADREKGIAAGLDLEMPTSYGYGDRRILNGINDGSLSEADLDKTVERILLLAFRAAENRKTGLAYDPTQQHTLARQAATESMVLLKNESNILPLRRNTRLAVVGAFAKQPRFQGGGSSHVHASQLDDIVEEIARVAGPRADVHYAAGFALDQDGDDPALIDQAVTEAEKADVAVLFIGLPERYESEGSDRTHLRIPQNQINLLMAVHAVQENLVLVLSNGAPIEMPWISCAKGVLEAYLGGQALGGAIAAILFGDANPCGKLAETFPEKLSHNPAFLNFPGEGDVVDYKEGVFVGYRYYQKKGIAPLFPFGFGLSYTQYEYSDISVNDSTFGDTGSITVTCSVKNTGHRSGKEIVQLYVRDVQSSVNRPDIELKAFDKIELEPGEEKRVNFELGKRAFAYFDVELIDWRVEAGEFEICIGGSSVHLPLKARVVIESSAPQRKRISKNTTILDIWSDPLALPLVEKIKAKIPPNSDSSFGIDVIEIIKGGCLRMLRMYEFKEEDLESFIDEYNKHVDHHDWRGCDAGDPA